MYDYFGVYLCLNYVNISIILFKYSEKVLYFTQRVQQKCCENSFKSQINENFRQILSWNTNLILKLNFTPNDL